MTVHQRAPGENALSDSSTLLLACPHGLIQPLVVTQVHVSGWRQASVVL